MSQVENIRLLGDAVLVRPIRTACSLTDGGILVPPVAHEKPHEGTVVKVGNGRRLKKTGQRTPLDVQPGDYVTWEKMADAHALHVGDCVVLKVDDLLAAL